MAKKKLADYQAKRDFKKTSEPSGKAKVRAAEYPRFVIQKHDATRLHYDLRLEHDGVFKSWAVTKGPSLNPEDKRLAVEVEDHPLDYGDFEGTIPKGEYGGGTVMLWDRGFWLPEGTKDVDAALRKGELKFTLAGDKLQGGWVLVRLKPRPRARQAQQLAADQAPGRVRAARTTSPSRTSPSPPAAPWSRSPPARAAAPSRSWRPGQRRPTRRHLALETGQRAQTRARPWHVTPTPGQSRHSAPWPMPALSPAALQDPPRPPRATIGCMRSSSTATACSCGSRTGRRRCARARDWIGPTSSSAIAEAADVCLT